MLKNTMTIDGCVAVITFDPEIEMFRGEFIGLNGGADFYAYSVDELKKEGAISLAIFLDECQKEGIAPYKNYSGKISARLKSEDHHALTIVSQASGLSINELLNEGVKLVLAKHESCS
ncbi:type II toxin-antitoxin system HicB family antitoxin [Providencia manganoxydans]|uniref:Type II toxin-antitoxin system HicB family antitoxin n=1 Tax=Providencia manganoxydans TaxID=2923283 RepID=A0ABX7AEH0_9GAMM|nr:type II toxin-antitoxin system HicB family antitoxin [Providencia manganoxydans]MDX4947822.1 type II toxin-antitoxin system HicB family antitoxin [Providencia manganoxydans]QQO62184.1 type II toxin-antitoxin system HicB family antitoxin [Providencia manganoxydans]HEF8772594.1 type II toxin-antitoxin system HicB family antitoxin [Providencia stuartii]